MLTAHTYCRHLVMGGGVAGMRPTEPPSMRRLQAAALRSCAVYGILK